MPHPSLHALRLALVVAILAGCVERTESAAPPASADGRSPPADIAPTAAPTDARGADGPRRWPLTAGAPDALPAGFTAVTGQWGFAGRGGRTGLLQSASGERPQFNVVLVDDTDYTDIDIRVRVEAVEGVIDRGGGPVWRAQDGDNYYVARWNPLEDNFRVYKVVDGVRTQLAGAATEPGAAARTIQVRMTGARIECALDGETLLRVEDTTFPAAGRVGLWTKADARTLFRDLSVGRP